jgi:hypothetical protein
MRVDINHVRRLIDELHKVNAVPFDEIEWCDGDTPIEIADEVRDEWKFTGLSNKSFVECEGWLGWKDA